MFFFNHASSMDKPTKTLGFGHCLHLSFSGLLAIPQLTGRGNAGPSGASVRCPSLSLLVLTIDAAATSTALAGHASSVPSRLHQPLPPSSRLPASSQGCPQQGFQPGLWVIVSPGASPVLVATRRSLEVPGSSRNLLDQRRDLQ